MSIAQVCWIAAVVVCAIATIIMALSGYAGYAATVAAVGVAASVNLLPRHTGER